MINQKLLRFFQSFHGVRVETKIEALFSMVRREVENVVLKVANAIIKDRKLRGGDNFDDNDDDDDAFKLLRY